MLDGVDSALRARNRCAFVSMTYAALLTACGSVTHTDRTVTETAPSTGLPNSQGSNAEPTRAQNGLTEARVSSELAHCAPKTDGPPWVETGRVDDQNRSIVMLAHADDPTNLEGALVLLAEGSCQADLLGPNVSASAGSGMPRPNDGAYARLVDQDFQWRVARSGGVERLANALVEGDADHIEECAPGAYAGCVPTWLADRLRSRGMRVDPPSS